ncbi:MAG TPA: cobyrinic acid a,c-diamide synthase [Nitrospiraceae bacterium]|jgi:cobyrinic acid a,c-diamide synthase|nr:cobyrinic acid a,c-diamide synthase [Nitrospiraceae bacterium]
MTNHPRLVIAGLKGGSGKTTVSLGLIAALRSLKGLAVIPFKKGPDYIDAGWMSVAAKNPCYNLDPFLISKEKILDSFISHCTGDIAVIEGNRGLYDGMDTEGSYSTAELAKLLKSPVILVIDCTKMTRTAAALVLGCLNLDRDVQIKGVVLNQVSGSRHESVIRAAIGRYCSLPVLGAIPRLPAGEFPERHMGLTPYQEHPDIERGIAFAEDLANNYLDIDQILRIAREVEPLETPEVPRPSLITRHLSLRIGVIKDSAFQFYYPENFEELKAHGATLIEISALSEKELPDIDALYIGGGFPETHAIALAENLSFRESLRSAVEEGLPVYAECGGLMYLGEGLLLGDRNYPMAGIFPLVFSLEKRPQAHGYSIVEVVNNNPFYPQGTVLKGHEFHYSKPVNAPEESDQLSYAFKMKRGHGLYGKMDGIYFHNVLATYTHLHACGAKEWGEGMVRQAVQFKGKKALFKN